jgi:hypothetical protein
MDMKMKDHKSFALKFTAVLFSFFLLGCNNTSIGQVLPHNLLAKKYYGHDTQWYLDNIPFFECSNKQVEQVYFYRWKLYKAHIRNVGQNQYVITEFINDVTWDRDPYSTINAATMHHIYEGRWLKDNRYMDGYINYMFQQGGNNRSYSESIADAAYARYLVNKDSAFIIKQLDSMKSSYDQWYDHFDSAKHLYYIAAMPDATEYTIASIDASGGKDGFDDGEAFRPTINSYMYGNAKAIASIAEMKKDDATREIFLQRAAALKQNVEQSLWNDSMQHFADRYKVNNQYVHYWNFIRGRELAGMIPWYFNLPGNDATYNAAWRHVLDNSQLLGKFGLRTNEPSYQYYFKQFVSYLGQRGSQWNGPSWPYQTSQVLTGMANLLNNYTQDIVSSADYVKLLRLFTQQHYLPNGKIDLVEDYDPDNGGPIVYYYWSNHYNHSSYNNLIISGLCGIRPSESDTLDIHPLVDNSIKYFCIDSVYYHGHQLTVVYDKDGSKYKFGKGIAVFVDGKRRKVLKDKSKYEVFIGAPVIKNLPMQPVNYALNIQRKGYPAPSASVNAMPDTALFQAVDGRIWYFTEITNRWTTKGSTSINDWYAIDFGEARKLSSIKIYLVEDDKAFTVPDAITVEYQNNGEWITAKLTSQNAGKLIGNTVNTIAFDTINTNRIRINFRHAKEQVAVTEIECY